MTLHVALATGALLAALVLALTAPSKALAFVAVVASAVELAMATGVLQLHVASVSLGLILPVLVAVPGVLAWLRAGTKPAVSASAIVAFVGALQLVLHVSSHL